MIHDLAHSRVRGGGDVRGCRHARRTGGVRREKNIYIYERSARRQERVARVQAPGPGAAATAVVAERAAPRSPIPCGCCGQILGVGLSQQVRVAGVRISTCPTPRLLLRYLSIFLPHPLSEPQTAPRSATAHQLSRSAGMVERTSAREGCESALLICAYEYDRRGTVVLSR